VTLPRRVGTSARLGAALALSPGLGGAFLTPLLLLHLSLVQAGAALVAVSAAVALVGLLRARKSPPADPEERATWWFALLVVAGVAAFPLLGEWWRIYSDAWTHAGIVRAVVVHGVPPLDPGFAGARLQYAWIYHAFAAAAQAVTGVDVYAFLSLLEACALAGLILVAGSAAARADRKSVAWTLALLVFGLNALFPLFLPIELVRAFTGQVRGWAEVRRIFALLPLDTERTGVFLRSLGGQTFFLDKYTVVTPFALALACTVAWWAAFRRWCDDGRPIELALAALTTLAAGLMHPVAGLDLGATAGLVGLLALAWPRGPRRDRALPWFAATLTGLVPVALYTATILGGKGGTHRELPVDLAPLKYLGYGTNLALALAFALPALRRVRNGTGSERTWLAALLATAAIAACVRLPGPSPFFTVDKFVYLVWIPLALTAGPAFAAWMSQRKAWARVALAAALFVPVNGLVFASRLADPHARVRQPWDRPVYAWLRAHTPRDAVLVTPAGDWETAQFAERDQYYSLGHATVQLGYPLAEITARAALVDHLFSRGTLTPAERARLSALGQPVYVVWTDFRSPVWQTTPGAIARAGLTLGPPPAFDPSLPLLFADDGQEVHGLPPEAAGGPGAPPDGRMVPPDSTARRP